MRFKVEPGREIVAGEADGGFAVMWHDKEGSKFNGRWPYAIPTEIISTFVRY